jgi:Glycosyl transferases group 1
MEVHAAALAGALAREGWEVEVCAPRVLPGLAPLAQRREERDGWGVTWINLDPGATPDEAGRADALGVFLERERPAVVHFLDLASFGLEAALEAQKRGLTTLYSADDWFAVSDQPHLLAPDGRPVTPGDRDLEARMAAGRELLRGEAELDPCADIALAEELTEDLRARLDACLQSEDVHPDLRAAAKRRTELKKTVCSGFDGRFATSKHLARRLSATLGRAIEWRAPGIDAGSFDEASPRREGRGLGLAYIGPLGRASGVHLLLEAFAGVEGASLTLHGDSPERTHVHRLRARARELGVGWGGPLRAEDVPRILAEADVRVIPAHWTGGISFAAAQAAAARRPVVAPRCEAVEELVRDDVNGLLFEAGDADSLRVALTRFAEEDLLLCRFELEARAPRSVQAEAREWAETYTDLDRARREREPSPEVPAYLEPFAQRHAQLEALSTRALLGQALAGLELLGSQMGLTAEPREYLVLATGRGSRLRDGVAADRRVIERLQRSVERLAGARDQLEVLSEGHRSQLAELRARLDQRQDELRRARVAVDETEAKSAAEKAVDQAERDRLEALARDLEADLLTTREAHGRLEEERGFLQATLEEGARELRYLRQRIAGEDGDDGVADTEAIEHHFDSLEKELSGLRDHEAWLRREVAALVGGLARSQGEGADPTEEPAVEQSLEAGREGLARMVSELSWRREEMSAARAASQRLFTRLTAGELASRAASWTDEHPEGPA